MHKMTYFVGIGVVLIILACNYSPTLKNYPLSSGFIKKMNFEGTLYCRLVEDLNALKIAALQVSVVQNDKATNFSIGTADYERKTEITNAYIFRVGSITKLYTAVIVMKQIEDGIIRLDDTIDTWFHEIPHSDKITVKNLLNHTSGI